MHQRVAQLLRMLLQVASLLGTALGMIMPSTVVFDYPTIDALSGFVAASLVRSSAASPPSEFILIEQTTCCMFANELCSRPTP